MCYWYEIVLCVTGMRMSFCALKNNKEFSLGSFINAGLADCKNH